MAETSSRSPSPSPLSRTTLLHEGAPQNDNSPDVEDICWADSHRVNAAAQVTLDGHPRDLEYSQEVTPLEDMGPEEHDRTEAQPSAQRDDSPGLTDSWSVLLRTGRTRNFQWHIAKHWRKYAFVASLVVSAALIYPALTLHAPQWHADSYAAQPKRPSDAAAWQPWHERLPRILLWNQTGLHKWWRLQKAVCATEREHSVACEIIEDEHWLITSDAVVFLAEHVKCLLMPHLRSPLQFWVFWDKGHPLLQGDGAHGNDRRFLSGVADAFNWTMSYRDDADIVVSHNRWRCDSAMSAKQPNGTVTPKTRADVAWILGSCEQHRFLEQVRRSREQRHSNRSSSDNMTSIRLFPACGKTECSSPRDCIPRIAEKYQFVMVSLKPDCFQSAYELIYDALKYNVVPVVLAPPNAALQVPEKSVVSSSQLQKPGELAAYLRDLLNNRTSYESYFAWKQNCSLTRSEDELCPLCRALWATPAHYRHRHSDLQEWWNKVLKCVNESLYGLDKGFAPQL